MECLFCKIISKEINSYKIYEDDLIYAFLDINQEYPGHTLIIPKIHTLDMSTIDENTLLHIFTVAKEISNKIVYKLNAQGYTLLQNNGISQEIKHFHLHILPKYTNKPKYSLEEIYNIITNE